MADLTNARALVASLASCVDSGDVSGGKPLLAQLKIAMLDFPLDSKEHRAVAISALEQGVLLSIADDGDMESFARNVAQVKPLYAAVAQAEDEIDEARHAQRCRVLGLNLMHLLVENRLSEFHAELELLSERESTDPHVTYPITLERQLMVGSYDEVLRATTSTSALPSPTYEYFVLNLLQTVRDSIADCMEVAYKTMSVSEARDMMRFDTAEETMEYVKECRDDWIVNDGTELCFQPPPVGSKASDVPSMKLISQSLSYATELERIV